MDWGSCQTHCNVCLLVSLCMPYLRPLFPSTHKTNTQPRNHKLQERSKYVLQVTQAGGHDPNATLHLTLEDNLITFYTRVDRNGKLCGSTGLLGASCPIFLGGGGLLAYITKRSRERLREVERGRHRDTQTHTDTHRDRHTDTHRPIHTCTHAHTGLQDKYRCSICEQLRCVARRFSSRHQTEHGS